MADLARIGPAPTLLQLEQQAFAELRHAQAAPSIHNMKRAVDVWRIYEQRLAETFPGPDRMAT